MNERYPLLMDTCHLAPKESDHTLSKKLGCSPCLIGLPTSPCSCVLDKTNKDNSPTHVFPDSPVSLSSKDLCDKPDQDLMKELDRDSSPDYPHASSSAQEHLKHKSDQDLSNDSLRQHSKGRCAKRSQGLFEQKSDRDLSIESLTQRSKGHSAKRSHDFCEQKSDQDLSNDSSLTQCSKESSANWNQDIFDQKMNQDLSNDSLIQPSKGRPAKRNQDLFEQKSYLGLSKDSSNQSSQQHVSKRSQDLFDYLTSPDFPCGSRSVLGTSKKPDQIQSLGNSSIGGVSINFPCCSTASQEHVATSDKDFLKEFKIPPCSIPLFQCNLFTREHPKKSDEDLQRENGISECFVLVRPLTQSIVNHWTQSQLVLSYRAHYCREYVAQVIRVGYNKYRHKKKVNWSRVYDKYLKDPFCVLNCDWFRKTAKKSIADYLKSQKLLESKRRRAKLIKQKETEIKQKKRVYYTEDSYVLVDRREHSDLYRKAVQNMKWCKVVCCAIDR